MNTIGKRLTYLIDSTGLNKSQFCDKYNFSYSAFAPITNDNRPLGMNMLMNLVDVFPNLNINWLLFGVGNVNQNINVLSENTELLKEPEEELKPDHFETLFLDYLSKNSVKRKIIEIINSEKSEKDLVQYENLDITLEVAEENSELMQRVENIIKRDLKISDDTKLIGKTAKAKK